MHVLVAATLAAVLACGSNWDCFKTAALSGQTASVTRDGAVFTLVAFTPPTTTLSIASAKPTKGADDAPSTCIFQDAALRAVFEDVDTMNGMSPFVFLGADACTGPLLSFVGTAQSLASAAKSENPAPTGVTNCAVSLGCLVRSLDERQPALAFEVTYLPLFGIDATGVTLLRISDITDSEATLYVRTLKASVTLDPAAMAQMTGQKTPTISSADLAAAQAKANAAAQKTIGLDGTCRFKVAALETVLRGWYAGNFSSSDYQKAEKCQGPMFPTGSQ